MNDGIEPKRSQQPSVKAIYNSQDFAISCRSYVLYNKGTDWVKIDKFPVPLGGTLQEGATEDGVLCWSMEILFEGADGKTQEVWLRQISDTGKIAPNQ